MDLWPTRVRWTHHGPWTKRVPGRTRDPWTHQNPWTSVTLRLSDPHRLVYKNTKDRFTCWLEWFCDFTTSVPQHEPSSRSSSHSWTSVPKCFALLLLSVCSSVHFMDVFLPVRFTGAAPSHGFRRMFAVRACVRVPHLGIKAFISSRREKKTKCCWCIDLLLCPDFEGDVSAPLVWEVFCTTVEPPPPLHTVALFILVIYVSHFPLWNKVSL